MGWSHVNVDEIEGAGPGGAVKFVRRRLGVEAFGINWFEIAPHRSVASSEIHALKRSPGTSANESTDSSTR